MTDSASLGFVIPLDLPFDQSIERLTVALKAEGFGILTRIDVHTTLKEKLGEDFRPYAILGVCNPPLAHRALSAEAEAGLMLPCNVTVEANPDGNGCIVRIADPAVMLQIGQMSANPILAEVAGQARQRLERAAEALRMS